MRILSLNGHDTLTGVLLIKVLNFPETPYYAIWNLFSAHLRARMIDHSERKNDGSEKIESSARRGKCCESVE